jgi:hypothetical protein
MSTWLSNISYKQEEITPNDSQDLPNAAKALFVEVAGDVKWTDSAGNEHTKNLEAGIWPLVMVKVFATGTTATGLMALVE